MANTVEKFRSRPPGAELNLFFPLFSARTGWHVDYWQLHRAADAIGLVLSPISALQFLLLASGWASIPTVFHLCFPTDRRVRLHVVRAN